MKKFYVHFEEYQTNEKKGVWVVEISLRKKDHKFARANIMEFMEKLGLEYKSFDEIYGGYDICRFRTNTDYDLSFFYVDQANRIYLSIICKNNTAGEKLAKVLVEFKEWEEDYAAE